MKHMEFLRTVVEQDILALQRKEATYKGSWKKRGGVGAYMVTIRKADRLEGIVKEHGYDIFAAIAEDMSGDDGTALSELRDLRCYLLLIEAEMISRITPEGTRFGSDEQFKSPSDITKYFPIEVEPNYPGTPENGSHHACWPPRLQDGLPTRDIEPEHRSYYMVAVGDGKGLNIVNRNKAQKELWEHLPRLARELNNKEHEEAPSEYKGLYAWDGAGNKWVMRSQYREHWGKE